MASEPATGIVIRPEEIRARVAELGAEITRDYAGRSPILIGVLKGSVPFLADLVRGIGLPVRLDFMAISSYGEAQAGVVRILKDLDDPIEGEDVILVEDIIDTGLTGSYLSATLRARAPATLQICTLLDKSVRRIIEIPIRYKGFDIPDEFVVGYGLDHEGKFRNLPGIVGVRDLGALDSAADEIAALVGPA